MKKRRNKFNRNDCDWLFELGAELYGKGKTFPASRRREIAVQLMAMAEWALEQQQLGWPPISRRYEHLRTYQGQPRKMEDKLPGEPLAKTEDKETLWMVRQFFGLTQSTRQDILIKLHAPRGKEGSNFERDREALIALREGGRLRELAAAVSELNNTQAHSTGGEDGRAF